MSKKKIKIGGILQNRNLAKIGVMSIPDRPGVAGAVFAALGDKGVSCPFIVHTIDLNNLDSIVLCVKRKRLKVALRVLQAVKETIEAQDVVHHQEAGMITVFGPHFGDIPGVSGTMFSALASAGINILAISTSISSLSCIVDEGDMDGALAALKEAFELP